MKDNKHKQIIEQRVMMRGRSRESLSHEWELDSHDNDKNG